MSQLIHVRVLVMYVHFSASFIRGIGMGQCSPVCLLSVPVRLFESIVNSVNVRESQKFSGTKHRWR